MFNNANSVVTAKTSTFVLCVIDFSESSKDALQTAINAATSLKSKLTVLYPYRLTHPRSVADVAQWKKTIDLDATTNFSRMTNSLLSEAHVSWEFKPEVGFIDDRIEAFTERNSVEMIVIGNELIRANQDALSDLLEKLKCPLVIVPGKQK